ncbi:hypothetical protein OUZ56_001458 [Daphnia magna]|uniref:Uncharacterized protein n=1 Tax=Daphnia magna TaxID=35525 RepID=A0ABR0A2R0_9CRUS|nr:hypothetical protein OUZ56_001458 [Daphnia magna]
MHALRIVVGCSSKTKVYLDDNLVEFAPILTRTGQLQVNHALNLSCVIDRRRGVRRHQHDGWAKYWEFSDFQPRNCHLAATKYTSKNHPRKSIGRSKTENETSLVPVSSIPNNGVI